MNVGSAICQYLYIEAVYLRNTYAIDVPTLPAPDVMSEATFVATEPAPEVMADATDVATEPTAEVISEMMPPMSSCAYAAEEKATAPARRYEGRILEGALLRGE